MVITKREDVTKQGSCKLLWRKLRLRGSLLSVIIQVFFFWGGGGGAGWEREGEVRVGAYLSLSVRGRGWGGGGRLLTFSVFWMGAYSRWALIRGWALFRINTVYCQK